jgi:hypothetical protein
VPRIGNIAIAPDLPDQFVDVRHHEGFRIAVKAKGLCAIQVNLWSIAAGVNSRRKDGGSLKPR